VRLDIYDVSGRHVRNLKRGFAGEGEHVASWGGRDSHGRLVASGVYFVRVAAGGAAATAKVVLLR
jgi:flagellar hook assembly protein FlgD